MAVLVDSTDSLHRTANLPTSTAVTACAWFRAPSSFSAYHIGIALEGSGAAFVLGHASGSSDAFLYNNNSDNPFSLALGANAVYFGAFAASGSGAGQLKGYIRRPGDRAFTTVSVTGASFTTNKILFGTDSGVESFDGAIWNAKVWNRALSEAELLIESYYRRVMFPASINFHWPLDNHNNTNDYSGNGRNATTAGTLTTVDGAYGLWRPRRRIFIPAAAAGGGTDIDAALAALTLSGLAAQVSTDRAISGAVANLALTANASVVSSDRAITAALATLSMTELAAAISSDRAISAALATLTLAEHSAALSSGNSIAAALATLGINAQSAVVSSDRTVQAALATLTIAPQAVTVALDVSIATQLATLSRSTYSAVVNEQEVIAIVNHRQGLLTLLRRR